MCKKYAYMESGGEDCFYECAFYGKHCNLACDDIDAKEAVSKVEQWSQSHPQKTMMDDFFEKFPNAPKDEDNNPELCPYQLGYELEEQKLCKDKLFDCKTCWNRIMR